MTQVELTCHAGNFPVPIEYVVPLTLFVVEAVTNAFRHAFPKGMGGAIILRFDLDGESAILDISDDGQGYVVRDEVAQTGTKLMHGFATQVDGELSISSHEGTGTHVALKFPLPNTQAASTL